MSLFRNASFTRLFLANFASQLGTVVGNMAFAFYLLDRFGSQPFYATIAELMYALPTLAVFLFVGVIADRLDRKRIAANSDWIRAGLTVLLLLSVHSNWLIAAFAILFLRSAVARFFAPAESCLLQGIMEPDQYVQAAGLNQTLMGLFMLFGMGLGAAAYQYLGIEAAIIIDGVSFLISGTLVALCRFPQEVRLPNGRTQLKDINFSLIFTDFREGLRYIKEHKLLKAMISGFVVLGFVNGGFAVLPIFTMKYKLSPDHYQTYASLLTICLGIGFLIGSALAATLVKQFGKMNILISGLLLVGVLTMVLGTLSHIWLFLTLVALIGCALAPVNVVIGGWIPEIVLPTQMGRVTAWMDPLMMMAHSAALGLIAIAFPAWLSVNMLYYALGVCLLGAGCYFGLVLPSLNKKQTTAVES
ncbi:MFS transporter [Paenibacillus sp. N3.4]|nr:MFS transporter [Paenibacillus sp. N3.4]